MIVRDAEQTLPAALASVRAQCDQLVVVDTGSRDDTVRVARDFGCQVGFFDWCDDFAAARNAALDLMRTDWVFILDSDEVLADAGADALRLLAARAPGDTWGVALFQRRVPPGHDVRGTPAVPQARLFRHAPGRIEWRFALHEEPHVFAGPWNRLLLSERPWIRHLHPVPGDHKQKWERDTRILRAAAEREPENPKYRAYLALVAAQRGELDEAISLLHGPLLELDSCDFVPDYVALCAVGVLSCLLAAGRAGEARELGELAAPHSISPDLWCRVAAARDACDDAEGAWYAYERAIEVGKIPGIRDSLSSEGLIPHRELALLAVRRGAFVTALEHARQAQQAGEPSPVVPLLAAACAMRVGRPDAAEPPVRDQPFGLLCERLRRAGAAELAELLAPGAPDDVYLAGRRALTLNDSPQLLEAAASLLDLPVSPPEALFLAADLLDAAGLPDEARTVRAAGTRFARASECDQVQARAS